MSDLPFPAERPRDVSLAIGLARSLGLESRPLERGLRAMKREVGAFGS